MSDEEFPARDTSGQCEEPPRMRDEPSALGSLFQRAAEDPGLTAEAVARVAARAEGARPTPPTPGAGLGPSMLAVLGLVAFGGLGAWHFWPATTTSPSAAPTPPVVHHATPSTPALPPSPSALPLPPEATQASPRSLSPTHRPARAAVTEPAAAPVAAPAAAPLPPTEGMLLLRARAALPRDPEGALALAESHRELYPHGTMTSEREVLAIEALRALGRGDAARARGERFLSEHEASPYRTRVENALQRTP